MQSEKGKVAMMRRTDTAASRRAQHPGPSGSAKKRENFIAPSHRVCNLETDLPAPFLM